MNREPAPAISRLKVQELNDAYLAWRNEINALIANYTNTNSESQQLQSYADLINEFKLPSYVCIQNLIRKLTGEERAALLALGWYSREQFPDWPSTFKRAIDLESVLIEDYQIFNLPRCLDGLKRWETKPQPFKPGRPF